MIRRYKFLHTEKSKLFLTSDTHFCHSKLLGVRGFKTIEIHNETLIKNWNSVVGKNDHVIHLGDFVLGAGDKSKQVCEELFDKLNGQITLLWGNHLAGVKSIYKDCINSQFKMGPDLEVYPVTYKNKVKFVGNCLLAHVVMLENEKKQNHFVFCSHFAHRVWIDGNKGVLHASGHSHSSDIESNPDWPEYKRLDVGVDNFNFTPLSFNRFLEIMNSKVHITLDHHDENTNPSF